MREQRHHVAPADPARAGRSTAARWGRRRASRRRGPRGRSAQLIAIEPDDGDEAAGDHRNPPLEHDQRRDHSERDGECRARRVGDLLQRVPELDHGAAQLRRERRPAEGTPSMPASWPSATWIPTPVRKPTSTVRRDEVREETEPRDPREDQEPARDQRGETGVGEPLVCARLEARDRRARRSRRRGSRPWRSRRRPRGGATSRRPRTRRRQQDRVEAGDHRRSGDLRVSHHLRDRERGQRDPRDNVPGQPRPVVGTDPLEQGHQPPHPRTACGR